MSYFDTSIVQVITEIKYTFSTSIIGLKIIVLIDRTAHAWRACVCACFLCNSRVVLDLIWRTSKQLLLDLPSVCVF